MADLTALFDNNGQSIWLDNLSRAHLNDGSLAGRIAQEDFLEDWVMSAGAGGEPPGYHRRILF